MLALVSAQSLSAPCCHPESLQQARVWAWPPSAAVLLIPPGRERAGRPVWCNLPGCQPGADPHGPTPAGPGSSEAVCAKVTPSPATSHAGRCGPTPRVAPGRQAVGSPRPHPHSLPGPWPNSICPWRPLPSHPQIPALLLHWHWGWPQRPLGWTSGQRRPARPLRPQSGGCVDAASGV